MHVRPPALPQKWGAWHAVEPGTNPAFLYQQNSLRDALVAALSLNILNNPCARLRMGNIARTVNVLQAMVLTEGERMLVTPACHVFGMYRAHHDGLLLPASLTCTNYEFGDNAMPAISASPSKAGDGTAYISLCHLDPNHANSLRCELRGMRPNTVGGTILTARSITSHNTFDEPRVVAPAEFHGIEQRTGTDSFTLHLPPKAVVAVRIAWPEVVPKGAGTTNLSLPFGRASPSMQQGKPFYAAGQAC